MPSGPQPLSPRPSRNSSLSRAGQTCRPLHLACHRRPLRVPTRLVRADSATQTGQAPWLRTLGIRRPRVRLRRRSARAEGHLCAGPHFSVCSPAKTLACFLKYTHIHTRTRPYTHGLRPRRSRGTARSHRRRSITVAGHHVRGACAQSYHPRLWRKNKMRISQCQESQRRVQSTSQSRTH